jgi:hypothetical protein
MMSRAHAVTMSVGSVGMFVTVDVALGFFPSWVGAQ